MIFQCVECLPKFCLHVCTGGMGCTSCQSGPANQKTHGPNHGWADHGRDSGGTETNPPPPLTTLMGCVGFRWHNFGPIPIMFSGS